MSDSSSQNHFRRKDGVNVAVLVVYLGCLLTFSSFFYLATEDYEAIAAVGFISEGHALGKSTGWPYTPLAGYLFYLSSLVFGPSLLAFRILTGLLIASSAMAVYLTLRTIAVPSMAFALTLLSYSLSTYPHPRLEYFIEGAFAAFAIFCAVRFIQRGRKPYLYGCALLAWIAFASRGHPNSSALLVLLPAGLVLAELVIGLKPAWNRLTAWLAQAAKRPIFEISSFFAIITLAGGSIVALVIFLRNVVYRRFFAEFADVNDLIDFSVGATSKSWTGILLAVFAAIVLILTRPRLGSLPLLRKLSRVVTAFVPFTVVGVVMIGVALALGYSLQELAFFIFPVDIIADHRAVGRIGNVERGIVPSFWVASAATVYFYVNGWLDENRARIGLFLLLLTPATFARFFPTYNMLYLGVFPAAVVFACILPLALRYVGLDSRKLGMALSIFFVGWSVAANYLLIVRTQMLDLNAGRLVKIEQGPLGNIFVEKDVFRLFEEIRERLATRQLADEQAKAFLSSRYAKLTPLVYGWNDALAGQNLMIQLGKIWSYDDVLEIEGVRSSNPFNWGGLVYRWRQAAVDRLEQAGTNLLVMSLYDTDSLEQELKPSSDPFREYLRRNFTLLDSVEPDMNIYRRSSMPEGAVIFKRNAQSSDAARHAVGVQQRSEIHE